LSELRTLLERRLAEAERGEVVALSASEIAEEVIRQGGEM
jgi:hypothetical protein